MSDLTENIRLECMEQYGFGTQSMQKVKVCKSCGTIACAKEQHCPECGARLPQETLFQAYKRRSRYCGFCDTVVSPAAQYCPKCGRKLKQQTVKEATK